VFFNPVTGAIINTIQFENLKRVEMLPFANEEMLQPLMLVQDDEKLSFHPQLADDFKPPSPVYLLFLDKSAGSMRGVQVDFEKRKLVEGWQSNLGFSDPSEAIVAVAGKSPTRNIKSK